MQYKMIIKDARKDATTEVRALQNIKTLDEARNTIMTIAALDNKDSITEVLLLSRF